MNFLLKYFSGLGWASKSRKRFFNVDKSRYWRPLSNFTNSKDHESYFESFKTQLGRKFLSEETKSGNKSIPAAYTYLGQFIGHDMTFSLETINGFNNSHESDPSDNNIRTGAIDLDSVYGDGPEVDHYLYDQTCYDGRVLFYIPHIKLPLKDDTEISILDMPRIKQGDLYIPVVPDKRNDENIIISQLHVAIMQFHNAIAKKYVKENKIINEYNKNVSLFSNVPNSETIDIKTIENYFDFSEKEIVFIKKKFKISEFNLINEDNKPGLKAYLERKKRKDLLKVYKCIFEKTKSDVILHFQWIIVKDYLPKIIGEKMIKEIIGKRKSSAFSPRLSLPAKNRKDPSRLKYSIPFEFSFAAFRFGHSMVRSQYDFSFYNEKEIQIIPKPLFCVKRKNNKIANHYVSWSIFTSSKGGNFSGVINLNIVETMTKDVPTEGNTSKNIIFRNIKRSYKKGIPPGQEIAKIMGIKKPICKEMFDEKRIDKLGMNLPKLETINKRDHIRSLLDISPLWFYILMEAEVESRSGIKNKHLGKVGSSIVGSTIIGILERQKGNVLEKIKENSNWKPKYFHCHLPIKSEESDESRGDFSLQLLFKIAGVWNGYYDEAESQEYLNKTKSPKKDSDPACD